MSEEKQEELNNNSELHDNDKKLLAETFKGKNFNDKVVKSFCERSKIAVTDAGNVQDFIYQLDFDERMEKVVPLVFAELAKFQYQKEYISDEARAKVRKNNSDIAINIAKVVEDNKMLYTETFILKSWVDVVTMILSESERRITNMGAKVLSEMAQEKLGTPLTLASLANEMAMIADRKAEKIKDDKDTAKLVERLDN